jgi:uncharacterized protein (DUF433 family)
MQDLRRITSNPDVTGDKSCIRGVRVSVGMIVEAISAGRTTEELLADFPILRSWTFARRSPLPLALPRDVKSISPADSCGF